MFSGIIEDLGRITNIEYSQSNVHLWISCGFLEDCHIDQSIAHNGVCLTVDKLSKSAYRVTAIQETLDKTNLGLLNIGDLINLERSLTLDRKLDGHLVQGHVDCTTKCLQVKEMDGSWVFRFDYPQKFKNWLVLKGSICVDGVSLTISALADDYFEVSIIPYTFDNTRFNIIKTESRVNVEFDIIGKYVARNMESYAK